MICPLCKHTNLYLYHQDKKRSYQYCNTCHLVFVPPEFLPSPQEEYKRYQLHQNDTGSEGYVRFLNSFIAPLRRRLPPNSRGLDFGSGSVPVLTYLLQEEGFEVENYDPYFFNRRSVLEGKYDFVTCVETAEHFFNPAEEWGLISRLVKPGGWIGVKTEMITEKTDFASWHYKSDITHVCFYSRLTFEWIGGRYNLSPEFEGNSMVFLKVGTEKQISL
ncbi:methyltransferase domain-containing protein [bacterium]|nr:methyltransferase domain-containing protein [bacterium]